MAMITVNLTLWPIVLIDKKLMMDEVNRIFDATFSDIKPSRILEGLRVGSVTVMRRSRCNVPTCEYNV